MEEKSLLNSKRAEQAPSALVRPPGRVYTTLRKGAGARGSLRRRGRRNKTTACYRLVLLCFSFPLPFPLASQLEVLLMWIVNVSERIDITHIGAARPPTIRIYHSARSAGAGGQSSPDRRRPGGQAGVMAALGSNRQQTADAYLQGGAAYAGAQQNGMVDRNPQPATLNPNPWSTVHKSPPPVPEDGVCGAESI